MCFVATFVIYPTDPKENFDMMDEMTQRVKKHGGTVSIQDIKMEKPRFGSEFYHEYVYRCETMDQLLYN